MKAKGKARDVVTATVEAGGGAVEGGLMAGRFVFEAFDASGKLKWTDVADNIIVNEGLDSLVGVHFLSETQITSWFVGLTAASPSPAAADVMNSHGGWTENTTYSEGTRPAYTGAAGTTGQVTNTASKASFSISGATTVGGAFLVSNSTKSGTTGVLYSVGALTGGNRVLASADTLNITYATAVADDGA